MTSSSPQDLAETKAAGAPTPADPQALAPKEVIASVDFAVLVGKRLLVYGWVLDFTSSVRSASIDIGSTHIDLSQCAVHVRRPDVAKHFALAPGHEGHGFYALVDLPEEFSSVDNLKLSITHSTGETGESRWPVSCHDTDASGIIGPYVVSLNRLLPHLSKAEANRLIEFGKPVLGIHLGKNYLSSFSFAVQIGIDLCCILENRLLVVAGWRYDPLHELSTVEVRVGDSIYSLSEGAVSFARPDIHPEPSLYRQSGKPEDAGFVFARLLPSGEENANKAVFAFSAGGVTEQLVRPIIEAPREAMDSLMQLFGTMEAEPAFIFAEQVAKVIESSDDQGPLRALFESIRGGLPGRLPLSIEQTKPRYSVHVDQTIAIADRGLFLVGWFNADPRVSVRVLCHSGSSSFVVSDNWSRHPRPDVALHLANGGIQSADPRHGYCCYVPLCSGDTPYYLSAETDSGERHCMRLAVPGKAESSLQAVRALVSSFNSSQPDLRFLMDHHIGPAVLAAWAARQKPAVSQQVNSYGARPMLPSVSVIVPLYGRHDFAEYQMALFASDPEYQTIELIYVVDDPEIYAEFKHMCADLYGIFQVPFTVVFSGVNRGFAGANNLAAGLARGQYLLFVNSDVLPGRIKWVGDLVRIYESIPNPGALGVKLLYEDGSVQHAGIAFRKYAGWDDLWINDHPFKGQSPLGLEGVREVDAVTAACALVKAELFRGLGGFSEDYIIGDFEDSDLCLRLSSAGRHNYVALDVELYHLERQSQNRIGDDRWRTNLTLFNCWLHNSRWAGLIEERAHENYSAVNSTSNRQSDGGAPALESHQHTAVHG